MTARKPRYTGPEVLMDPNDRSIYIEGVFVWPSDIPEFIARLQKFAPKTEHISETKRKAKAERGSRK